MLHVKRILFLILIFTLFSCGSNNSKGVINISVEDLRQGMDPNRVEVLFFHNHERCSTCLNMEKLTREVVDTYFGKQLKEGKLVLMIIDIEDKKNAAVVDDYQVVWTSLFINNWVDGTENRHNMTEFSFLNSDSSPDMFKEGIRQQIEELLYQMDLGQLLENSTIPLVTALLLGIQTAICPCPMTTNITAIGFIGKDIENRKVVFWKGILFATGNIIAYTVLAIILIPVIKKGLSTYTVEKVVSEVGTLILPFVLITFGLIILFRNKLYLPSFSLFRKGGEKMEVRATKGYIGALFLGMVLAMAFCPTTGLLYFGMLLPMSALTSNGYLLPLVFSLAAALPVVFIAWIMAFGIARLGKFFDKAKTLDRWLSLIVASAFIAVGIYFTVRLLF